MGYGASALVLFFLRGSLAEIIQLVSILFAFLRVFTGFYFLFTCFYCFLLFFYWFLLVFTGFDMFFSWSGFEWFYSSTSQFSFAFHGG